VFAALIDYRLLGPIEVRVDGQILNIGGLRQRALLAVLLLRANEPVSRDVLAEHLWQQQQPPGAPHAIDVYVSRLRKVLAPDGRRTLMTVPGGYLLQVGPDELDVYRVERLAKEGHNELAAGAPATAAERFSAALALWRGDALADLRYEPFFQVEIAQLEDLRIGVFEDRIGADLALGRHASLIGELGRLVAAHPLRERLAAQLMVALYRCGRRGEALAGYDRVRAILAEELGIDPGPELRDVHARVLCDHPSLSADAVTPAAGPQVSPGGDTRSVALDRPGVPRQLPSGIRFFASREAELAELDAIAGFGPTADTTADAGAVVIAAISGMAGVGKTALAIEWATKIAARFPDGQLYVNLRGYDVEAPPVAPDDVTSWFLSALGVPALEIPVSAPARLGLYRSVLANRRVLIMLDNARNEAQVRPLLAGGPGCLVVVTSRASLTGLVASAGAHPLPLRPMNQDEAWRLLAARLGDHRLAAEPDAAMNLLMACGGLPLGLAITAAQVAVSSSLTLAELADRLASDADRLSVLDTGDEATTARAVFSWSFRRLSESAARAFGLLGLHGGPDISLPATASLAGLEPAAASRVLAELTNASLVSEYRPGRYLLHDLLRSYAAEQARAAMPGDEVRAALLRSLDHYLHTAASAPGYAFPLTAITPPLPGVRPERLTEASQLSDWLRSEHLVLMEAIAQAASLGAARYAWQLCYLLGVLLARDGHWADWDACGQVALDAAARAGDYEGLVQLHVSLASRADILGDPTAARQHNLKSLEYCKLAGDRVGEARAHANIAQTVMLRFRGMAEPSAPPRDEIDLGMVHAEQAAKLFRAIGSPHGEGLALTALATLYCELGSYKLAGELCDQALGLQRDAGNQQGQVYAWHALADMHRRRDEYAEAARCYHEALNVPVEFSPRLYWHRALVFTHFGDSELASGDLVAARAAWQRALQILDDLKHPHAALLRARLESAQPAA